MNRTVFIVGTILVALAVVIIFLYTRKIKNQQEVDAARSANAPAGIKPPSIWDFIQVGSTIWNKQQTNNEVDTLAKPVATTTIQPIATTTTLNTKTLPGL